MNRIVSFLVVLLLPVLCTPGSARSEELPRWTFGIGANATRHDFRDRFPDEDGLLTPRPGQFRGDVFDHVGSSQTARLGRDQTFSYDDLRTLDLSVEYRIFSWLGVEAAYTHMDGLEFDRPMTQEVGYFKTGRTLTFDDGAGTYCDSGCDRYALDLQGFRYAGSGEIEGLLGMVNFKLYGPDLLGGRFQPFALVGGGLMRLEAREKGALTEFESTRGYFAPQPPTGQDLGTILPVDGPIPNDPYFTRDVPGGYSVETREQEMVLNLELGVVVPLTEHFAVEVRGSYKRPTGKLAGFDFFSAGTRLLVQF